KFINIFLKDYKNYYRVYINNIVIVNNIINKYIYYFNVIFFLFTSKNIILFLKKSYLGYFSVEFLNFYVDNFKIFIIKDRIKVFKNLTFLNNFKALE
ncbi:hypothetical protein B0T20DRAFT_364679, partial [Sordaria brevicollis]